MEKCYHVRTMEQLGKHLYRCNSCKSTASFCYRFNSLNNVDILRTFFHCHSYFCETCAKKKKNKLYQKFKRIKFNGNLRFITLTLSTKDYSPEKSLDVISKYFNLFVKHLRYKGFKFQYFKIIEFTKNGIAHVHALVNCYIDYYLIKDIWKHISGNDIVFIQLVKNKQIAINYLFKYMQKAISSSSNYLFYLMNKRRYSYSQSFFNKADIVLPFIQSRVHFFDDHDLSHCISKFFSLKFSNYKLLKFNLLN